MIKLNQNLQAALLAFLLLILTSGITHASSKDEYRAVSRYDYYTTETSVEVAVWIPESKKEPLTIDIVFEYEHLLKGTSVMPGQLSIYTFPIDGFHAGDNELTVSFNENGKWVDSDKVNIKILEDRYNAVKIDRVSGGLIVDGLPFIPFGFYAYSPVQPTLAEEEAVKGFNMMSPYQKIEGKTLKERKAYMDRCATLGMKVNYNLLSVAGGGGVGHNSWGEKEREESLKMLRKEIETFRDHPALLSWYISDEPVGQGTPIALLEEAYNTVKELDPYHPVTIVFMSPWMAEKYSHVMDIVMADPYPIPNGEVLEVGNTASMLHDKFFLEKPVWIVPQAFGGNEWWEREPTAGELRAMTYLSMVNNASGIQYFIRHGLNSFPKSTIAWNECGAMAMEIAEITPFLFSADPVPELNCDTEEIQFKVFHYEGSYLVIAVNTVNKPLAFEFTLEDMKYSGSATVLFEDRKANISGGRCNDIIAAYGSLVYKIRYKMMSNKGPKLAVKNMVKDPSFEDVSSVGVPAACYARPTGDRGATYFLDPRTSIRGDHSLRITTPADGEGMDLSFYRLRMEPGRSYTMSVQAKALPMKYRGVVKKKFFQKICGCGADGDDYPLFTMAFADCEESFIPDGEWHGYSFSCVPKELTEGFYSSPTLTLDGKGTAWFDLLQLYPDMEMKSFVNRDKNEIAIHVTTIHKGAKIYYTTDGTMPTNESEAYKGVFRINKSAWVKVVAYEDEAKVGYISKYFVVSHATGRYVEYKYKYSPKYDAGLKDGLVDGILGSSDFKDEKWQGFEGEHLDVTINLKSIKPVNEVEIRFMSNKNAWIFLPEDIKIFWSANGVDYQEYSNKYDAEVTMPLPNIHAFTFSNEGIKARYIRIRATNIGVCPEGHPGAGGKAWLFSDEIIIR